MRLLELHLLAYGPFTDRRLDLSAGEEGLHLILGRNEAGKSSALRALKALLYGIPERTQDDFIHATSKLRVGGRLRHASGRELYCYRRKGHRNTLLDADGRPLPDETMQDFLYGVDAAQFERRFGLDYDALVRGGESLLDEHGREAEALFGSALGRAHLKNVLDRLDREAAELFVPRGQKPLINAQLNQLADLKRRLRDVSLSAHRWDESRQTLDRLKGELAEIESRLTAATARRQTLERLRRTLPALARRARLREQLDALADAPWLPPDLGARYQQAEQRRRLLREQQRMARARLAELTRKADAEPLAESLLAQGEAIDRLRERLGSHRKAAQDRPHLVAAARVQAEQAAQRLALIRPGLGLEAVASLSPLLKHRRLATELGEHREALDQAVATATAQLAETERLLAEARATLDALPAERLDLEELERAIQASRRDGDLDQAIAETTARLHLHLKRGAQDLAALGLWSGDLTDLLGLPLPSEETVRRFGSEIQTLDDAHRRLLEQRNQTAAECHRLKQVLRTLQLTGPVPSEDDLRQARHHRDRGWQLIRRQWLTAEDLADESAAYASGLPLPEAFEQAMAAADALADRLRCEMQRVHDYATTQAALETQQRALAELEAELNALSTRRCHIESDWETLWAPCGLKPLPPREMLDWLGRVRRIQDKAVIADELRQTLDLQYAARARHLQALSRLLNGPGNDATPDDDTGQARFPHPTPPPEGEGANESLRQCHAKDPEAIQSPTTATLTPMLERAESRLREGQRLREQRQGIYDRIAMLNQQRQRLTQNLEHARAKRAAWQREWAALTAELGLSPTATPADVSDHLESIAAILKLMDEVRNLEIRIQGIDRDADQFVADTRALLETLAPDLLAVPVEVAVPRLHQRLIEQREASSRRSERRALANQTRLEISEIEAALQATEETLAELCRLAGCSDPESLPEVLERARERRRLTEDLQQVEAELIASGDGLDLAALEQEAQGVEIEAVVSELARIEHAVEQELQPRYTAVLERRIHAERDFSAMTGSDEAALLAEEIERTCAALCSRVKRYVRVCLAARILREAIEQFRQQHRNPLLASAGAYFTALTCQRFIAVDSDFDVADQSILVGVRANGERVRVESMSTGTRDQLYLALRLAHLDLHLAHAPPLPFIVDDILIQFDDERARATLEVLADLSNKTQVILFTHHGRVVEQAQALPAAEQRVFVQVLD